MRNKLKKLRVTRIDRVDVGANQEARILIAKSIEPASPDSLPHWERKEIWDDAQRRTQKTMKHLAQVAYPDEPPEEAVAKFAATSEGLAAEDEIFQDEYQALLKAHLDALGTVPDNDSIAARVARLSADFKAMKKDIAALDPREDAKAYDAEVAKARELIDWARNDPAVHARRFTSADTRLTELTKARQVRTGETFAKAQAAVLDTEEGRALYAEQQDAQRSRDAGRDARGIEAFRVDKRRKAGATLLRDVDQIVKAYADRHDVTKERAEYELSMPDNAEHPEYAAAYAAYGTVIKNLPLTTSADVIKASGDGGSPQPTARASFSGPDNARRKETTAVSNDEIQRRASAAFPGVTPAKAYALWLDSEEGKAWYAENRGSLVKDAGGAHLA